MIQNSWGIHTCITENQHPTWDELAPSLPILVWGPKNEEAMDAEPSSGVRGGHATA